MLGMRLSKTKSYLMILLLFVGFHHGLKAQSIPAMKAEDIIKYAWSADTVYVINFWATWCQPCVQELPEFNKLFAKSMSEPVRVLLVSLDFPEAYPTQLQTFVQRKGIKPPVAWLNETDPNVYIPKLDNTWQGSIPATIFVRPKVGHSFVEGQLNYKTLNKQVTALLHP
jgi:thiol-disulfide isomerase/thioredoxin